jgi:hypothetical protein
MSLSAQTQKFTSTKSKVKEIKMTVDTAVLQAETSPGPNPSSDSEQLEVHPGWVRSGVDNTPGHKAYYINLEAKPGEGDKVQQFLRDILAGVEQEPGTGPWFGCRFSDTTFGIFEAFPDTAARNAHDIGPGGSNFLRSAELDEMLAYPAHLYRLDVMFGKFSVMFGKTISSK